MKRALLSALLLLVGGCGANLVEEPTPVPPEGDVVEMRIGEPPLFQVDVPALVEREFGELRMEDGHYLLPASPVIRVKVEHAEGALWLLHQAGTKPTYDAAILRPEQVAPGEWVLRWERPPETPVQLTLCADVAEEYPYPPDLVDWHYRCVILASHTVRALPSGASP